MPNENLENLVRIRKLQRSELSDDEIANLITMGRAKLNSAKTANLDPYSKFDLLYNAAHALALAALWREGYRSQSRYIVFQCTQHTINLEAANWRVLSDAHNKRNLAEYEGIIEIEEQLLGALERVVDIIADAVG